MPATATFGSSSSATSAGYIFNEAGTGTYGLTDMSSGTVQATAAELANPFGVAVGPTGTIYIADTFNNVIEAVNPSTGVITVVAGRPGREWPSLFRRVVQPPRDRARRKRVVHRRSRQQCRRRAQPVKRQPRHDRRQRHVRRCR